MATLWNRADHYIFVLWFLLPSSSCFIFLAYSQPSQIGCLQYFHTWRDLRANLECRSKTCCTAHWKYRTRKIPQNSQSAHHRTTLSNYIFATKARIEKWERKLLNSNISLTCTHNTVNFGPLVAEIGSLVWGTPAYFNGFCVLASLL